MVGRTRDASFDLRFDRAQSTAKALADHFEAVPEVARVIYPLLRTHPDAARAERRLKENDCNIVSFELRGGRAEANAFTRAAAGLSFTPTLSDVGTALSHPASSSHRALTPEKRAELGFSEGFFRVSVGLEVPEVLISILERAILAAATETAT